jgi:hypothetical protein
MDSHHWAQRGSGGHSSRMDHVLHGSHWVLIDQRETKHRHTGGSGGQT